VDKPMKATGFKPQMCSSGLNVPAPYESSVEEYS